MRHYGKEILAWTAAFALAILALVVSGSPADVSASLDSGSAAGFALFGIYEIRESQLPRAALVAGQRGLLRMRSAVQTACLDLMLRGQLDVTVAGTAVRNRGSLLAAFSEFGVEEAGRDRVNVDLRSLAMYSESSAPSAITKSRAAGFGVQAATLLVEPIRLYYAHPYAVDSMETAFLERDPRQNVNIFATIPAAGAADAIIAGGTKTLTNVTVDAVQRYDATRRKRPLFVPSIRQLTRNITAASPREEVYIRSTNHIRAIIIQQDSDIGEVNDIVRNFTLRGDTRDIYGPEPVIFSDAIRRSEFDYGGLVGTAAASGNGSYLILNFQNQGRLSNVLNPAQDVNLRFEFDAVPSVTAGVTRSTIRITLIELEHANAGTDINGRSLVDPLPFAV